MNNNYKSILNLIISIAVLLMLFNVNAYAKEAEIGEYSQRYLEWLELSEEEKDGTIAPFSYNIRKKADIGFLKKFKTTMKSMSIPSSYDLREDISIEVKDQEDTGECWAFSANTSLETYLALNGEDYNFSERHLDYSTAYNFSDGVNPHALNRLVGDGGYISTAFTYYSRGSGPILEEDMPFENNEYTISIKDLPNNSSVKKVDNMIYFSNIYKTRENGKLKYIDANNNEYTKAEINDIRNQIKEHIMKFGAISANVYAPSSYYNELTCADNLYNNAYANHTVTIIGWDDNYKKENFIKEPSEDGAYIVLNSWGSEWGNDGVYYVSYEDFLIESELRGVTSVSDIEYDNLYQHDISEMGNCIKSQYAANIFNAKGNEKLTEVMIGSLSNQICDIYINAENTNLDINNLTKIASNVELKPGYNTIKIDSNIYLSKSNNFAIIVKLTNADYTGIGIEDNNIIPFGNANSKQGESFVSEDGISWNDIYDKKNMMNLSIKAYTQTEESNVEIIDIRYPNKLLFENLGGKIILKLKTTTSYEGKKLNVKIFDNLKNEVTSQFKIDSNIIKDKQGKANILVSNEVKAGKYFIKILNDTMVVAETEIIVSKEDYDTNTYMKVQFSDENLYKALKNNVLSDNDIYAYFDESQEIIVRKNINSIDLEGTVVAKDGGVRFGKGYKVSNLSGLENFTNLTELNLSANPIEDLRPIENLTNLQLLQIYYGLLYLGGIEYNNPIKNIDVIGGFTKLKKLELTNCELEDITFLKNLKELRKLDLQQNKISDISPLKDLNKLDYLCLGSNKISDISNLENLTNLNTLILQSNQIKDIEVIKKLERLSKVMLNLNQIEDATILDEDVGNVGNVSIDMHGQVISKEIIKNYKEDKIILQIPKIIQQACDAESNLYSEEGVGLMNCEWNEYGKSIKFDTESYESCSIKILSGLAYSSEYSVKVKENRENLTLKLPDKLTYKLGEELDLSGASISYVEGDSAYWISLPYKDVTVTGYDKNQLGVQTITVIYEGKSATFEVTVVEEEVPEICKITISSEPRKTVYIKGEALDLEDGTIVVEEKDIVYSMQMRDSRLTIEGFDSNKIGEQTITISYKGQKVTFKVIVKNDVVSISISNLPKTTYIKGEEIDFTNGKILVKYEDGSKEEKLMTAEDIIVIGYDKSILGKQTITLKYLNTTTTLIVNVICEHVYEEWNIIEEATCEETGKRERMCNECKNKETEVIEKIGHIYLEEWTIDKEPTCKEKGSKSHHCARENCESKANITEIPLIGHSYGEWTIDKEPTYEEEGNKYRICINCKIEKEEEKIPRLIKEELEITTTYVIKETENIKHIIILPETTVSEFLRNITTNKEVKILDKTGKELKENDLVGTGAIVITKEENKEIYKVVIKGDVNGDGLVKPLDVTIANSMRLNKVIFNITELLAADLNENGKVDPVEITMINSYRLGKINSL